MFCYTFPRSSFCLVQLLMYCFSKPVFSYVPQHTHVRGRAWPVTRSLSLLKALSTHIDNSFLTSPAQRERDRLSNRQESDFVCVLCAQVGRHTQAGCAFSKLSSSCVVTTEFEFLRGKASGAMTTSAAPFGVSASYFRKRDPSLFSAPCLSVRGRKGDRN